MAISQDTVLKLPVSRHPAFAFWNPLAAFRSEHTEVPRSSCGLDKTDKGCGARQLRISASVRR